MILTPFLGYRTNILEGQSGIRTFVTLEVFQGAGVRVTTLNNTLIYTT